MNEKRKFDYKWILIALLIIIVIILLLTKCDGRAEIPIETVISANPDTEVQLEPADSGKVRVRVNSYIRVKNGKISNLEFANFNETLLMELTLVANERTLYESSRIGPGESIQEVRVDSQLLERGENEAIANIRYYQPDGTYDGETNFDIILLRE